MLWEIEIFPKDRNPDLDRVRADYDLLTHSARGREVLVGASRGYLVDAVGWRPILSSSTSTTSVGARTIRSISPPCSVSRSSRGCSR